MNTQEASDRARRPWIRRPLFWWPITLFTLTTVLMLFADRVSAWHRPSEGDSHGMRRHAERILDRLLAEVDATDEQAERIQAIGDETFALLAAAHEDRGVDAAAFRAAISAESLDRAALESLRRAHLERAEALSEAVAARFADALEVLTPEQRQRLIARVDEFRAHRGDHHRGPFGGHGFHDHRGFWHGRPERGDRPEAGTSPANGG